MFKEKNTLVFNCKQNNFIFNSSKNIFYLKCFLSGYLV